MWVVGWLRKQELINILTAKLKVTRLASFALRVLWLASNCPIWATELIYLRCGFQYGARVAESVFMQAECLHGHACFLVSHWKLYAGRCAIGRQSEHWQPENMSRSQYHVEMQCCWALSWSIRVVGGCLERENTHRYFSGKIWDERADAWANSELSLRHEWAISIM